MEKIKNYIEFKKLFKNITEKFVRDLDITLIEAAEYSIIEFEIYLSEYPEDSTFIFTAWAIYLLENNCLNERGKDNFFIAEMKKCYLYFKALIVFNTYLRYEFGVGLYAQEH